MQRNKKPKTINSLLKYLRKDKKITISGSNSKRELMNIGYYHGYKGYRYIKNSSNQIRFNDFNELLAIYEFDSAIKSLFYPYVMQIETALKNYAIEVIINETGTDNIIEIYNNVLDDYKSIQNNNKRKEAIKQRLKFRESLYRIQSNAFNNDDPIAIHFLTRQSNLPIWALFELMTLGDFGQFIKNMNLQCRLEYSRKIGIKSNYDVGGRMPEKIIFVLKDYRNSIAHNKIVFDTRFRNASISSGLSQLLVGSTNVKNITFDTITDYLVLIVYLLSLLCYKKTEMKKIVSSFDSLCEDLRKKIDFSVYSQIIYTNNKQKINDIYEYIKKYRI